MGELVTGGAHETAALPGAPEVRQRGLRARGGDELDVVVLEAFEVEGVDADALRDLGGRRRGGVGIVLSEKEEPGRERHRTCGERRIEDPRYSGASVRVSLISEWPRPVGPSKLSSCARPAPGASRSGLGRSRRRAVSLLSDHRVCGDVLASRQRVEGDPQRRDPSRNQVRRAVAPDVGGAAEQPAGRDAAGRAHQRVEGEDRRPLLGGDHAVEVGLPDRHRGREQ